MADVPAPPAESAGPLKLGVRVEIRDLKSRPDLNGKAAEVVKHDEAAGRWEVRVDSTGQSIRCKPENLAVLPGLPDCPFKREGDDAFKSNHYKKAIECYRESLAANPDSQEFRAVIHSNMSAVWAKQGDQQKALEEATEAVRLRPAWPRGHSRQALALFNQERYADADRAYGEAVALDPTNEPNLAGLASAVAKTGASPDLHKQLGNTAIKAGDAAGAVVHYTRAIGVAGAACGADEVAAFHSNRSAAFARLTAWGLALRDGQAAVKHRPEWPKAHVRVGCALLGTSHHEDAYKSLSHALSLCPAGYLEAKQNLHTALWRFPLYDSPASKRRFKRFDEDADKPNGFCRVFAVSDVHIDHSENHKKWVEGLSKTEYQNDVLIVAGDLGDTLRSIQIGLGLFKKKFRRVFYTPGNHDMWVRQDTSDKKITDSITKLVAMFDLCEEMGAEMLPARVMKGVYVVPLLSWYNYQFNTPDPTPSDKIFDTFCKWPMEHDDVWKWFLKLNDHGIGKVLEAQRQAGERGDVISFSHFLPRYDLPWPGVMGMVKASGCKEIERQVRDIHSRAHIFGHSHINCQRQLDGVAYTQFSLNDPNYSFAPGCPLLLLNADGQPQMRMHSVY
eukprot:CAMPEP_0179280304 /NCGR_PEP_ID=MMETSP0797-20121207/36559_1 /TAXON_ID=47934 /ORGANISM="Dinophysis acuminata, Strain DAEP01" /LENGTH=616 /DNA_ID=CAMNT_0020988957 /DNA_START=114 /DNA_END=1964 /DNA_ORIENTATION=+